MDARQEKGQGARLPVKLLGTAAAFGLALAGISFVSSGASADYDAAAPATVPAETTAVAAADAAVETIADGDAVAAAPAAAPTEAAVPETGAVAPESEPAAEEAVEETVEVVETVEAVQTVETEAPQPAQPEQSADADANLGAFKEGGVWNISVNCAGGQSEIDGCVGATNFLPAMEVLGVPYYAQHDYLGGAAWLNIQIGETVVAEGATYQVTDMRTIYSGGSSDQVVDMAADAFLQTCLDDGVHSRVLALTRVG